MYATDAIILKKMDVGEHDTLYMLYTRGYGKMRAVAAGIKKPEAKLRGHLEPLSLSHIRFIAGKRRERLIGASLVSFWGAIRADTRKLVVAHHMVSRIDHECMEGERDDALWELLARSFYGLDAGENFQDDDGDFIRRFDYDLREVMGYGGPHAPVFPSDGGGKEVADYGILDSWAR